MDKGGILGGIAEELGKTVKTAVEQVAAKGAYTPTKTPDLTGMQAKEEKEKAKNLARTRQNLVQMMQPPKSPQPRPAQKVEIEKRQELQQLQQKQAKKPPPLPITAKRGTVEKIPTSG